jgi:hypothetical protein
LIESNDSRSPHGIGLRIRVEPRVQVSVDEEGVVDGVGVAVTNDGNVVVDLQHYQGIPLTSWSLVAVNGSTVASGALSHESPTFSISSAGLARGLYVLTLTAKGHVLTRTVLISQ